MTRTPATRSGWVDAALVAVVAILATVAAWVRLPEVARGTVWAEDGTIFLNDAISGKPLEHLFAGYMGYLQFVPRLLADGTVALAQVQHFGLAINFASCAVAGLCAALVYWCAQDVVPTRSLRLVLAAISVGAPLLPIEVLGNAANVHWLFIWTLLWVFLYRPRSRVGAVLLGLAALACALSDIQLLFLVPLFLVRRGSPLVWPPRVGLALGLIAQIVITLASPRTAQSGGLGGAARAFIGQTALATFIPDPELLDNALGSFVILWTVLAIAPFLLVLFYVLRRGTSLQRVSIVYLVPGAFALWTADSFLNGYGGAALTPHAFTFVRYAVVPSMYLLAAIVVGVQVALNRPELVPRMAGLVTSFLLVGLLAIHFIPYETNRSHGPAWEPAIERAEIACDSAPGGAAEPITTAPFSRGVRWMFLVPCSLLDE